MKTAGLNGLSNVLHQETLQSVVHDLRTPMTVIKGYLELLLSGAMGEMASEHRELIRRSVGPLDELILMTENLLQAATLEQNELSMDFRPSDLDQMLAETIEFYQLPFRQRRMEILRQGNTLGVQLLVDPVWLKRVLHNLIWNAFKFTPDGGRVSLHVRHRESSLEIAVQDTGRGIPSDKLHTIFGKFEQLESKDRKIGAGLGLWICSKVLQLHGGSLRVESQEGRGSRFILSLPASRLI
jgi:signal transduction histidine kinase